jgi:hypothetical protein
MNPKRLVRATLTRLALAGALALGGGTGLLALAAEPASASPYVYSQSLGDADGDGQEDFVYVLLQDGEWWAVWDYSKLGVEYESLGPLYGNPNPDDPSSGAKDTDAMIDLAKQHGGSPDYEQSFWESRAGQNSNGGSGSPDAVWNPGDDDGSGGQSNPMAGIDEKERIDFSGVAAPGQEIEPNGGSPADQINHGGGPGGGQPTIGSGNDGGNVDTGPGPPDDPWWMSEPVAPAVNPPPEETASQKETAREDVTSPDETAGPDDFDGITAAH